MPRPKTADVLAPFVERLTALEQRVEALEKPTDVKQEKKEVVLVEENPEHRRVVTEILNKDFNFLATQDFGGMRFAVLVPQKYSNASQAHWDMYHQDERPSRPFAPNEAEAAIKNHLETVFSNFNPDTKALIVNDR